MKVLLSGGGTAGHITPLLAVAKELRSLEPESELIFIGQKGDKNISVVRGSEVIKKIWTVRAGKFRRFHSLTLWQNITNFKVNLLNARDAVLVVVGFIQSIFALLRMRPDVIFFKGGFVVVPIGYAARLLRIPYITHDSDPLPGLANRLIAKGAKHNAVVDSSVTAYPPEKTVVTGVPLAHEYVVRRKASQAYYKQLLGIDTQSTLLFVYAGSTGARVIDDALETFLPRLLAFHPTLQVVYVIGRLNEESMSKRYKDIDGAIRDRLHFMTFIDNAFDYIAAADIVLGRAGATTMAEFATIGRASIIIPAEQLTGGHQLKNVELYGDHCIEVVRESTLPGGLEQAVESLLNSPKTRLELEQAILHKAPLNAAKNIAELLLAVGNNNS